MPERKRTLPEQMAGAPRRLRDSRDAMGWTQEELEEKSGVDQSRISRLERGERLAGMEASAFVDLAAALGVRAGWLLTGEPPRSPQPIIATEARVVAVEVVEAIREELGQLGGGKPPMLLTGSSDEKKRRIRRPGRPIPRPESDGNKSR